MSRSARLTAVRSKGESSDDPHAKRADAKKGCADARGSAFVCLDASGGLAAVPPSFAPNNPHASSPPVPEGSAEDVPTRPLSILCRKTDNAFCYS